jgi:prepilin-type N-terminal cleavage/methylation domain-containing protein
MPVSRPRGGFTLIELLVVIAIIALLIGILLPALGRARNAGRLAVSLNNLRQILIASANYRFEKKDNIPMIPSGTWSNANAVGGYDTWNYGGKDNNKEWATIQGGFADEPAYCRPLNGYNYPEMAFEVPTGHAGQHNGLPPHTQGHNSTQPGGERELIQMPVYKSPGDKASFQGSGGHPYGEANPERSSYDDVGTSYHVNMKWFETRITEQGLPTDFSRRWFEGLRRIKLANDFDPTGKFVWIHDQTSDVVANTNNANLRFIGEFQDINKSVHAYLDGHAGYNVVTPRWLYDDVGTSAGQSTPTGHSVGKYTFLFVMPGRPLPPPGP